MGILPLTATEVSRSFFSLQSIVCHLFYLSPVTVSLLTRGIASVRKWWRSKRHNPKDSVPSSANKNDSCIADENEDDGKDTADTTLSTLKTAYATTFLYQTAQHIHFISTLLRRQATHLAGSSHIYPSKTAVSSVPLRYNILSRTRTIVESLVNNPPDPSTSSSSSSSLLSRPLAVYELATLTFSLFTVWDLWRREVVTSREARLAALGCLVGPVLVGPGALSAGLWYWRECIVARKQQQRGRRSADQKH